MPDAGRSGPPRLALVGDNVEQMDTLASGICTAMVTDPHGGISTLGLEFEKAFGPAYCRSLRRSFKAALRVLKPGAVCVVWAYPITFGWAQLALINAGYEIVLIIPWINAEGRRPSLSTMAPGCEFWIVARTPGPPRALQMARWKEAMLEGREPRALVMGVGVGRALDELIGRRKSGAHSGRRAADQARNLYGRFNGSDNGKPRDASDGGPSRFFVTYERLVALYAPRCRHAHRELYPGGPKTAEPTPKAVSTMLPLVDLACGIAGVDAKAGVVLDPHCGSGSTAMAAGLLGHGFVGIDKNHDAVRETQLRLDWLYQHNVRGFVATSYRFCTLPPVRAP